MHQSKWLQQLPFSLLVFLELKFKEGSLEHGKTWFGQRFFSLVISANLHGYLFHFFLWVLGFQLKKGSLEHCKTWF